MAPGPGDRRPGPPHMPPGGRPPRGGAPRPPHMPPGGRPLRGGAPRPPHEPPGHPFGAPPPRRGGSLLGGLLLGGMMAGLGETLSDAGEEAEREEAVTEQYMQTKLPDECPYCGAPVTGSVCEYCGRNVSQ